MPDDDDSRLTLLEERFCHQEVTVEQLHDALVAQQRVIDQLTARLARLERLTVEHQEQLSSAPPHERPPHY